MSEIIHIGLAFDLNDAQQKLDTLKGSFETLKQSFQDAPNATKALNQGLDRSLELVGLIQQKIDRANETGIIDEASLKKEVTSGIDELSALSKYFNDDFFGAKEIHNTFSGLSSAIRKELDSITRDVSSLIKSNMKSLNASTVSGIKEKLLNTQEAKEIFGKTKNISGQTFSDYIEMLIPNIMPAYMLNDYHKIRYGTSGIQNKSVNLLDVIPKGFIQSFNSKGYIGINKPSGNAVMDYGYRKVLRNMVGYNDAALRAAELTQGMLRYNRNGKVSMANNITPAMYDEFRRHLFEDFVRRASGNASDRIDIFDDTLSELEQRRVINRMTSSSTGRVLKAMETLDGLSGDSLWNGSFSKKAYGILPKTAKRSLEEYQVLKHNFEDIFKQHNGSQEVNPGRYVTLTESQNTRLLGLSGHHNEFTDKVLLVSMNGYDKNNDEHKTYVDNLLSGKPIQMGDKRYIAQNIHGTGEHTVIRMIEETAYEAVRREEAEWAKEHGFVESNGLGANYWNNYVPNGYDFRSVQGLRKHLEATGKGWSPGSVVHGNFQNRNFAIVDISKIADDETKKKFADGLSWFAEGVLPYGASFQNRIGVAGKGTSHTLYGYKTLGEWARAVGLADKEGRFYLPGPNGKVDLTDMHGIVDASQVKNLSAYDQFQTPSELNAAFTAQLQRYGMSSLAAYEDAETRAKGIGAQAMAFVKLSPKMQDAQINEYARRWRLLDTETGVEQYILGDSDNYLADMLRGGKITVRDPAIQTWVQAERESLMNRIARGEWIDFGDQPSVVNQMINKNIISSILESVPEDRSEKLKEIRKAYENKTGEKLNLSDDDLAGVFALDEGKLVDFARPDEEYVSVIRSPNGFGNFVVGKNYAKLAAPIYQAFGTMDELGTNSTGLYLSEADMFTLGDADFDGDRVKTVYGEIGAAIREAKEMQDEAIASLGAVVNPITQSVELPGDIKDFIITPKQSRLYAEASMEATEHMGGASSAGMRATMLDLYDPRNRDFLIAALQSNRAYAETSAEAKAATETKFTENMKKALFMNAQWSKLPTKYSGFFNVTGKDDMDIPNPADIATINMDGQDVKINLDALRKAEIDKINFRSAYNSADIGGLRAATEIAGFGVDKTKAKALLQALDQNIGYGDAGEKTRSLMQNLRYMKIMDMVDPMAIMNDKEIKDLDTMIAQAEEEIKQQANVYANGDRKKRASFIATKSNEYGISAAKAYIGRGITRKNLLSIYGEQAPEIFPELFDATLPELQLPNKATGTILTRNEPGNQSTIKIEVKNPPQPKEPVESEHIDQKDTTVTNKPGINVTSSLSSSDLDRLMEGLSAEQKYERIMNSAYEFKNSLTSRIYRNQEALSGKAYADIMYENNKKRATAMVNALKDYKENSPDFAKLTADQQFEIDALIGDENSISTHSYEGAVKLDYASTVAINSKKLLESIRKANKWNDSYDEKIAEYKSKIEEQKKQRENLIQELSNPKNSQEVKDEIQKSIDEIDKNLPEQTSELDQLRTYYSEQKQIKHDRFMRQQNQMMRNLYGGSGTFARRMLNYKDSLISQYTNQRNYIQQQLKSETDPARIADLQKAAQQTDQVLTSLNGKFGTSIVLGSQFGNVISNVATRLGRQLFQKALNEARKFVQEFDASMNEIQAITMKSDQEMQSVRTQTVNKAIGLKTSVSNVAQTEAALYRQGLSDAEVSSRTDSIIKFATVTKLKVTDATKIITTALQNNLVRSAEEAMDALVALGDSAATTAAEIGKGMQKAAASAKVAGVSYAELTALLTFGTSDTQLSGTQIGTALQTIFSRMRKLSVNGYDSSINGESMSANDAEEALRLIGVDLWEGGKVSSGTMRSSFDILVDVSKVWNQISDAQKSIVTNALAGTRQTNIFSTLMEGLSEDGGKRLEEYLGLGEGSEGITQSKYEIAMQSLAASFAEVKSSFDAVVESFTNNGIITGTLDLFSGFLQQIAELGQSGVGGQIGSVFSIISGGIAGIATACLAAKSAFAPISTFLGLLTGVVATGSLSMFFSSFKGDGRTQSEKRQEEYQIEVERNNYRKEFNEKNETSIREAISKVEEAGKAYNKINNPETSNALTNSLQNLSKAFPQVSDSVKIATNNLSDWNSVVDEAKNKIDSLAEENKFKAIDDAEKLLGKSRDILFDDKEDELRSKNTVKNIFTDTIKSTTRSGFLGLTVTYNTFGDKQDVDSYLNDVKNGNTENDDYMAEWVREAYRSNKDFGGNDFTKFVDDYFENEPDVIKMLKSSFEYSKLTKEYSGEFEKFILNIPQLISSMFQEELVQDMLNMSISRVKNMPFDLFATNYYDASYISQVMENAIKKKYLNNEFVGQDGIFDLAKVDQYIIDQMKEWASNPMLMTEWIKDNADGSIYSYAIKDSTENQIIEKFSSYDLAEARAQEMGYSPTQIVDKDGNVAYQTAAKLIDARIIQQNAGNEIQKNLYAMLSTISDFNGIEALESSYDKVFRSSDFANIIASDSALLMAYRNAKNNPTDNNAWQYFIDTAKNIRPGRDNTLNVTDYILSALFDEKDGKSFATSLRTEEVYNGAYEIFKGLFGDIADIIINAAEDGTELSSDIQKKVRAVEVAEKIKEATQYMPGYDKYSSYANTALTGTFAEKMAVQQESSNELSNFMEFGKAVTRYKNGKAYAEDYQIIGQYTHIPEAALRNSDLSGFVSKVFNYQYKDKVAEGETLLTGLLAGYNDITLDDIRDYRKDPNRYTGDRNIIENVLKDFSAFGFYVNSNGNIGLNSQRTNQSLTSIINGMLQTDYSNNIAGYEFLQNNWDKTNINDLANTEFTNGNFDYESFLKNNPMVAFMLNLARSGKIDETAFKSFLTSGMSGADMTTDYYSSIGQALFGSEFIDNGFLNVDKTNMNTFYNTYKNLAEGGGENTAALEAYIDKYRSITDIFTLIANGDADKAAQAIKEFNAAIEEEKVNDLTKYTDASEDLAGILGKIKKGGLDAASGMAQLTKKFQNNQDLITAASKGKGKGGAGIDDYGRSLIAGVLGIDAEDVKNMTAEELDPILDEIVKATNETFTADIQTTLDKAIGGTDIKANLDQIGVSVGGTLDLSQVTALCDESSRQVLEDIVSRAGEYGEVIFEAVQDGNTVKVVAKVKTKEGSGYNGKRGGGGGGGGGKSAVDKLLEKQDRSNKISDHEIKMIQYREAFYEADSQLGNYGNVLQEEQNARERYAVKLEKQLEELRSQYAQTVKESDDWYKLRDAILAAEEAIEDNINAMGENKRKIEENRQAILKLHTDLEDTVREEIKTRIDEERNMLESTAGMEQTIINIIRNRYTEEWDLIKKDIEKKKEALEEEKDLIDERLQARKDAESTATNYEEMEELRSQYARISMDTTRSKEAMELRNKIAEKQKENAWRIAEEEAEANKESLDDQIDAYDQFVEDGDEALEKFLEDANNFADEVAEVLKMNKDELIAWLKDNDKEYKNSLENTQLTMIQGWEDTFKQMYGIVDVYWTLINDILSGKNRFMEYMRQSTSYQTASEDAKAQMEYEWSTMYDDWMKAQDTSATYHHTDDDLNGIGLTNSTKSQITNPNNKEKADQTAKTAAVIALKTTALVSAMIDLRKNDITGLLGYSEGGLVKHTGLAMVHGTPSKPESFIDAEDTVLIRSLLDVFDHANIPFVSKYDSASNTTNNSIGDVYVTINEAELNDDADLEDVAERVGELFAKNLEKQGFSTANYNL